MHPKYLEMLKKAVDNPSIMDEAPDQTYDLIKPELAEVLKRRARENGPAAALNDMLACDKFDIMDKISQIKVPVLALCGDKDIMTPPKYSYYLAQHMPNAKATIIPGGTHMVFAEKPEEVNQAIEFFLKEL